MKRTITTAILSALILLLALQASAAGMSVQLTGPGIVRAGDNITLSLKLNGNKLIVVQGEITFDASHLEYTGTGDSLSGWKVDMSANGAGKLQFMAEDDKLSAAISGKKQLCTIKFKVKSVSANTKIIVNAMNIVGTDGTSDFSASTTNYSVGVSPPLSSNNLLSSLTVSNATISPGFNKNTTSYTADVPFEISKLDVKAVAEDGKAKVSINTPTLTPNSTTNITITVTAENGGKKTYTIKVKRAQDPNYKPSGNADLSNISVDKCMLSPPFQVDIERYVVWLPYEVENLIVTGKTADSKTSIDVIGGEALKPGKDTPIKVICRAEDGSTREYTVIARRAAPEGAVITEPETTRTEPEITTTPSETQIQQANKSYGPPIWLIVIIAVVCAGVGFGIGFIVLKKRWGQLFM